MSVDQQFNIINDKLQLLLKQYNRLQKENERLKEEIKQAQLKEAEHLQQLDDIRQQVSIMKVSSGELGEKDKKDFEKKINQYIKEIDRCISFMSQ
jgi:hypothetical protein